MTALTTPTRPDERTAAPDLRDPGFILVLAGLVLSCFAGHWRELHVPVPLDRGLLAVGLAVEWDRARRRGRLPAPTATGALLIAAAAWTAISFIASPVRDVVGFWLLVDLAVLPAVLFISARVAFGTARRREALAKTFTVFGIYLGFTAITQTAHLTALVLPAYILDPAVGIHADRARGPYVEAVDNGLMLIICGGLSAWLLATTRRRGWRVAGGAAVLLTGVGCVLTLTRAIWIAAGVAALIALLLVPAARRRLPQLLVLTIVATGVFALAFPGFGTLAADRGGDESPIWDRLDVNAAAARMVAQEPLTGVGWNQAGTRMAEFVRQGADYPVTAASAGLIPHNVFLGRYAELGIIGGTLWLVATLAMLLGPVLRRSRPGFGGWRIVLLVLAVSWAIVANFGPVNYSEPAYLLALVAGITASGVARPAQPFDWRSAPQPTGAHRG